MSGGHFDYKQYEINQIIYSIKELIESNNNKEFDKYGYPLGRGFSKETIEKFKEAELTLRRAEAMAQRIDWLVSGDEGEKSFHERWKREVPNE